ncbi:MAG: nuclear transport factor 2 family protein [Thermodesulfobacteriota bacterium]
MTRRMEIAKAYEKALFAGDWGGVARLFTEDVVYWVAGEPPIGGEWRGRDAVLRAFREREFGLGAADWGYDEVWRDWYDADDRVIVEIRERSWLGHAPDDRIDQRTCVVIRFAGERICEMRDYSDASVYERFRARHPELPRFRAAG